MSNKVNDTLVSWAYGQKIFSSVKNDITNLFGKDVGKRDLAARNIAKSVWGQYRMLGPIPMFWEFRLLVIAHFNVSTALLMMLVMTQTVAI